MSNQIKRWWNKAKLKSGWLVPLLFYKVFENWILGLLQTWLGDNMIWLLNHIGQITWGIIGLVFLYLMVITWRDTRRDTANKTTLNLEATTNKDKELLDSFRRQINHDRANLTGLLVVRNERLFHYVLDPVMGGELHFAFEVFNGSILTVKLGNDVKGNMFIQGKKCHDEIEPLKPVTIDHGIWDTVMIKQRVLPELVKEIRDGASNQGGIVLRFNLRNLYINIEEAGSKGVNPLKVVLEMEYTVKRDINANVYEWKRNIFNVS
jgi:hypothetical protein